MPSWYLRRFYGFVVKGEVFVALNEIQKLPDPHGGAEVHGQLSHTWHHVTGDLTSYHYNLRKGLEQLETIAFFYLDDPPTEGVFPAGQDVVHLLKKNLPPEVRARWPDNLRPEEIVAHGARVGRLFWQEDKRSAAE